MLVVLSSLLLGLGQLGLQGLDLSLQGGHDGVVLSGLGMQGSFLASGLPAFLALRGRLARLGTLRLAMGGLLTLARLCGVLPLLLPALAGVVVGLVGMPMPLAGPRVVTRIVGEHRPLPPVAMLRLRMLTGVMRIAVLSEILHGLEYPIILKSLSNPATAQLPPTPVADMVASPRGHEHHPYIGVKQGFTTRI